VWGIFSDTNKLLLQPDNILSVKDDEKTKVSNFPVEEGAFASYNKVKEPFNVKVMMTKGGTSKEIEDFLSTVRILKNRTSKLVSVVTPEDVFLSATLEGFDYSRETGKGQNLIHVNCHFLEIRQVSTKYSSVSVSRPKAKNPSSSDKTNSGHVQPAESEAAKKFRANRDAVAGGAVGRVLGGG
jgi:hypothetical protein